MATVVLAASMAPAITLEDKMHSNIARGNKHFAEEEHDRALARYRAAQMQDSLQAVPHFNSGGALYRLGKFDESTREFLRSASTTTDSLSAMSYYNLGNSVFRGGDYASAVDAYKKSLLVNPKDEDARFNLQYAMRMQQQQEQQQERQEQQEQVQQQNQPEDRQSQQQDRQQREDQQDANQPQDREQDQSGRSQAAPSKITPEDLKRILAAVEASDKNTQEEVLKQASRTKRITGKDW